VKVNVLVPRPLTDRADCEAALRALCACQTLVPDVFDVVEPVREPFDPDRIGDVLDTIWRWQNGPDTFMWRRRRRPAAWGGLYMSKGPEPVHGSVDLESGAGGPERNADLVRFLRLAASGLGADLGLIDVPPRTSDGTERCMAVTTWDLRKGLPDLYWGTVFGGPYVELFGARRLAEAPVARCGEIAPGMFYLQLTDDLDDLRERPELVQRVRAEAKRFLGLDAFAGEGVAEPCRRLPQFTLRG
jgi:hypothetical protein